MLNIKKDPIQGIPKVDTELYHGKRIIIIHNTSTPNATAENENMYFHREWSNIGAFVHAFVDWSGDVYEHVDVGTQVWGAGNVNKYAWLQVEQCVSSDPVLNRESAEKTAEYVALKIKESGIPFNDFLILSHGDATTIFGGSDHYDTIEGMGWEEFTTLVRSLSTDKEVQPHGERFRC